MGRSDEPMLAQGDRVQLAVSYTRTDSQNVLMTHSVVCDSEDGKSLWHLVRIAAARLEHRIMEDPGFKGGRYELTREGYRLSKEQAAAAEERLKGGDGE